MFALHSQLKFSNGDFILQRSDQVFLTWIPYHVTALIQTCLLIILSFSTKQNTANNFPRAINRIHDDVIISKTFFVLQSLCEGNSPVTGGFPSQMPVRGALLFSLIRAWINGWADNRDNCWFEMLSRSLWRHCNGLVCVYGLVSDKRFHYWVVCNTVCYWNVL